MKNDKSTSEICLSEQEILTLKRFLAFMAQEVDTRPKTRAELLREEADAVQQGGGKVLSFSMARKMALGQLFELD